MSSRLQDPEQKIQFLEGRLLRVTGGGATLEVADRVVYMVISVRNVGTGQRTNKLATAEPRAGDPSAAIVHDCRTPGNGGAWLKLPLRRSPPGRNVTVLLTPPSAAT